MRYLKAILWVVALIALFDLAVGRQPAWFDFMPGIVSVSVTAYSLRAKPGSFASAERIGPVYAVLLIMFAIGMLSVWAYRIYAFVASGRLLVSGDWSVSWSERPIGLIAAIAMYLVAMLLIMGMAIIAVFELKRHFRARRGHVGPT